MAKKTTVYDIAKELGLSPSTVSRVLNNSALVGEERTKQILETARRLGYQKRMIKRHTSRAILNIQLFIPADLGSRVSYFLHSISELIDAIQLGLGGILLNFTLQSNHGSLEFLKYKKTSLIDACLFAFTTPSVELEKGLEKKKIPLILLNREAANSSYISYDIPQGISLLAQAMQNAKGKELRPCYLGFSRQPHVSQIRSNTAQEFFQSKGIPFGPDQVLLLKSLEDTPTLALDWVLKNGFNGVMAFNDLAALSFFQAALNRGISIPEDLLLCGFDNSPIQNLFHVKIDTIDLSISALAQVASTWLHGVLIEKKDIVIKERLPVRYIPGHTICKKNQGSRQD